MAQPITSLKKSTRTQSGDDLNKFVQEQAYSTQSSINQRQRVQTITKNNNKYQKRNRFGDQFTTLNGDRMEFSISDSKGNLITRSLSGDLNGFINFQEANIPPTIDNFPDVGDWGWYYDAASGYLYLPRNVNTGGTPTLENITITTLDGQITATQHGNLSLSVGTMHSFTQITGTITNDKHGALGRVTSGAAPLHTNATGTEAGFLSTTFFTMLNTATTATSGNTLALRDNSGNLNASTYQASGTQVVGARNTGWSAFTGVQDKITVYDPSTITLPQLAERVSAIQAALTTHGLLGA